MGTRRASPPRAPRCSGSEAAPPGSGWAPVVAGGRSSCRRSCVGARPELPPQPEAAGRRLGE
eukprot:4704934-Lingulodinium_polyedra.AAC.1